MRFGLIDSAENDRKIFHKNAEETRNNNLQIIEGLKKENKQLKILRDELIANKRVEKKRE